jgi:hypothetical protein
MYADDTNSFCIQATLNEELGYAWYQAFTTLTSYRCRLEIYLKSTSYVNLNFNYPRMLYLDLVGSLPPWKVLYAFELVYWF